MDAQALRAQFPVLERIAYLNSGTDGPLPAAAVAAARARARRAERDGRTTAHFERRFELQGELRAAYARLLGAPPDEIALTTSTSDGLGRVLAGLGLGSGDEIVTSDQEHPGLLGPLLAARRRGVTVRAVPLARVAEAVGPETTLVALSHVSWIGGEVAPAALSELDVPGDPRRRAGRRRDPRRPARARLRRLRGVGPEVALRRRRHRAALDRPGVRRAGRTRSARATSTFVDPAAGLEGAFKETAARFDTPALARETLALSARGDHACWSRPAGRRCRSAPSRRRAGSRTCCARAAARSCRAAPPRS